MDYFISRHSYLYASPNRISEKDSIIIIPFVKKIMQMTIL